MKTLQWGLIAAIVLMLPVGALAAVQGSDHDLTAWAGGGGAKDLCFACHVPHNAFGDKLWASDYSGAAVTFTAVQKLCWTCHNGSVTTIGQGSVMNAAKQQHKSAGTNDCSGGTGSCHDVHNQNPAGSGKFTTSGVTLTNGTYCATCHDGTAPVGFEAANGLGDHTAGITHYTNGTTFTCNQCHTIHGATPQGVNPGSLTNPILLADNNQSGSYYGAFCVSCHNGTAPTPAAVGTGGVAASDVYDYAMATNDGTETAHPTTSTTGSANWATGVGGCNACHDVHDPSGTPGVSRGFGGTSGYILKQDNTDSAYCVACHEGGAAGPTIGTTTHWTGQPASSGMNSGLTPALPWANEINEDGNALSDWTNATTNEMVCETCHSVHRLGNTGVDAEYFLRHENGATNQLCRACHTTN